MSTPSPTGCGTALATPFTASGEIDEPSLRRFVDWQIDEGIDFLVPCGSTWEARRCRSRAPSRRGDRRRAGAWSRSGRRCAGSNDTQKAIALSLELKAAGATHLLPVAPMYSEPPQRGMALALSQHRPTPSISRSSCTTCRAAPHATSTRPRRSTSAAHPGIVGTKEASGLLPQITDIIVARPSGIRRACRATTR
jgi:4-hydroxy-tetrahydrodipicolinate synthase